MTGKKFIKFRTEIVSGKCPTCEEHTMLVGITPEMYRGINCGADLQQHVNGKISYLPSLTPTSPMSTIEKLFGYGET